MSFTEIKQPPYNASVMGVMKAAADHFDLEIAPSSLYGLSGHAFITNVHAELCPSGPYVWNHEPFYALLSNAGLAVQQVGFIHAGSTPYERTTVEKTMKTALDDGNLCGCLNTDNQIIYGYDDRGFDLARPWGAVDGTPARLTFGSWVEFGDEMHVTIYTIAGKSPAPRSEAVQASLRFMHDVWNNPDAYSDGSYGMGPRAYENWIQAVENGCGGSHGAWWNATVWSECKERAAEFLGDVDVSLSQAYRKTGEFLKQTADKEMPKAEKLQLLNSAYEAEKAAVLASEEHWKSDKLLHEHY